MHASVGDRLRIHGRVTGQSDSCAEILEVRGDHGQPPYRVRFDDGHESLVFPGADCVVEPTAHGADR